MLCVCVCWGWVGTQRFLTPVHSHLIAGGAASLARARPGAAVGVGSTAGSGDGALVVGADPPEEVLFVEFVVTGGQVNVRAKVLALANTFGVGGSAQRSSTSTVRIRAASASRSNMASFLDHVTETFRAGSVPRAVAAPSRLPEHVRLSMADFYVLKTPAAMVAAGGGRLSADPDEARSMSTRSSRGF